MATLEDHNYTKMEKPQRPQKPAKKQADKLGEPVIWSIPEVPVTQQRRPFLQPEEDQKLVHTVLSVFIIHGNFSYPTVSGYLPDPLFRIFLDRVHKDKHGSDTNTYDTEGRFNPQKFEDIFSKYAEGRDYMTIWDVFAMLKGQRLVADPIGWGGAFFEYGRMTKEDIRGIYDGSLFYTIAARRAQK
ncbi:hypothetical protein COL516b_009443 [Colletotrichum fioriniae]|nr:uncharacterized protein COL516b_009443 [Colletotrichum fioriniae]KAJ0299190.1 hypothetical protein COL516b_009443 [Colletotrichum fioriniae]